MMVARMLEVVCELGSGGLGNGFVKGDSLNSILQ